MGRKGVSRSWRRRGQATTEMVLLVPIFLLFAFVFVKIFAMLVLIQRIEIASYYAARRWQLESHRNVNFEPWDKATLLNAGIRPEVRRILGCRGDGGQGPVADFLSLRCKNITVTVKRTQVWNIVKLTVPTRVWKIPLMKETFRFKPFVVTKYVPNRDRPIGFNLPGL